MRLLSPSLRGLVTGLALASLSILAVVPAAQAAAPGTVPAARQAAAARPDTPAEKAARTHRPVAAAAAAAVNCNYFWTNLDNSGVVFSGHTDAAVRTGADKRCAAIGRIYNQYTVWYDCYTVGVDPGTGWDTWTHLHYWLNGAWHYGWVNDGLLPDHGSDWYCWN